MNKQLLVNGVQGQESAQVILNGIGIDEPLTPKMAEQAARIAYGHRDGVTVEDEQAGIGYRLYAKSARKIVLIKWTGTEAEKTMSGEELFDLFVGGASSVTEVAKLDLVTATVSVNYLRRTDPDDIAMTGKEIASAILEYARSQ